MKYVLAQTVYRPWKPFPEVTYIRKMWNTTDKLSKARVRDTHADAAEVIEYNNVTNYKVMPVTKEQLFTARLKGI